MWTTGGGALDLVDDDCFGLLVGGTMTAGLGESKSTVVLFETRRRLAKQQKKQLKPASDRKDR